MNIGNNFKKKSTKENEQLDISKMENELLDIPKVVFEDLELQVTIGQWLGILPSQQGFLDFGFTRLSAEELMKRGNIPAQKLEEIETKFGLLLKQAGISNTETCNLNQFDKKYFSFHCHLNNNGNDAKISLRWGNMERLGGFRPKFIITFPNEEKTYDYYEDNTRLKLQDHTITIHNSENGYFFCRDFSSVMATFILQNREYSFFMAMIRPKNIKVDDSSDYVFRLENEEQLQQYLLGLTFPLKFREVYKKICEISLDSISKYPIFLIQLERNLDKKITDKICSYNGKLNEVIKTNGKRTITIDSNGNWVYDSSKYKISQSGKGKIKYSLKPIPSDELLNASPPSEQYDEIIQGVKQARKLAMAMSKGKKFKR